MIHHTDLFIASLLFLFWASFTSSFLSIAHMHGKDLLLQNPKNNNFFLNHLLLHPSRKNTWEIFFCCMRLNQILLYVLFSILWILSFTPTIASSSLHDQISIAPIIALAIVSPLFIDCLIQKLLLQSPTWTCSFLSSPVGILLLIPSVITFPLALLSTPKTAMLTFDNPSITQRIQSKLTEWMRGSHPESASEKHERRLLYSVISFQDRITREVMVPRIRVHSLPATTSLFDAAKSFLEEGYSRIPIYKDRIDSIVGVLLYKDVLNQLMQHHNSQSDTHTISIESLIKPVVYAPETKKISALLQEFRSKKNHLAVVVDEYGGFEGIVTIEDILEELVGEIEDEFDTHQVELIRPLTTGGWVIDAKMGIIDIEEEIGIQIPPSSEYDTIGGFVFHKAGAIPKRGWKIHLDRFDLEVIDSDDRSINKIKISPNPQHIKQSIS